GVALGTERDLDSLLDLILTQARRITSSDAGSLYLIEGEPGQKRLRFRLAQTYSKPEAPFVQFTMPMDRTSLAGYAAVTGEPLVIDDAYFLPPDVEYTINRSFDERYGYRTKSMLVIPMKDHKEQVIGVLQLINRKRRFEAVLATPRDVDQQVVPFSKRTVELVTALAGQAAVAIENGQLYREIERLFEGFVRRSAEREFWRKRAEFLETHGRKGYEQFLRTLEQDHAAELGELEHFMTTVLQANEPTVLPATHFEELLVLAGRTYQDLSGVPRPYLTDREVRYLTIPKGSLDETERLEIESHVNHTYSFLKEIPWTRELHDIPLIAYGHHEKLDGHGYPRGVTGDAIPVQTRMMTISDIYDALTAADRPYKPAVAPVRALDNMDEEVRAGQL